MASREQPKKCSKKNRKGKSKSRKSNNRSKTNQKGGTSSACVLDYANKNNIYNAGANIHNTNPQASLDLDNKFISYGGPVPLGSSIVGGGSCGSEGVGTSNPKSQTFKEYMSRLDENLSVVTGGNIHKPEPNSKPNSIKGGGYSNDPSSGIIGGQPVVRSYDDNSPPAIIGGQLVFGSPDQPICGNGAVSGGSRRNKKKSKKNSKKNKKQSKNSKCKSMKRSKQRGGDFTTFNNSKPADYATAFNGPPGFFNYPDDMKGRTFDGRQPEWKTTAI
jgi:hypothetical protein